LQEDTQSRIKTLETLTVYKEKGIAHFVDLQAKAALYHKATAIVAANQHRLKD